MKQVGTIQQLWRYPVKGVAGETVEETSCGPRGIEGDRLWALWDVVRKEIQSCKFRPGLLRCSASFCEGAQEGSVEVLFPDGARLGSDDPEIHEKFTGLVGYESRLEPLPSVDAPEFFKRYRENGHDWLSELEATFTREPGEPLPAFLGAPEVVEEFVSLPGTFFLVASLHIISSSTMSYMKSVHSDADWDIRRFRPNIVVDTGAAEGLVEQDWVGKKLHIGGVSIDCVDTAVRCGAVTRPLEELPRDPSMLRSIVKEAEQNLGIYGEMEESTILRLGDPVYLNDA